MKFGPAGNSDSFYASGHKASEQAPKWIHDLGLNAFEYSFGRGVRLSPEKAALLKAEAQAYDVTLSAHAPYYISLSTEDPKKQENNWRYLRDSVIAAQNMGAKRVVLHPGSCAKQNRKAAFSRNLHAFAQMLDRLKAEGLGDVLICPETMGKLNQLGDVDEVLEMCAINDYTIPTIDFGHVNARTLGGLITQADFARVLDAVEHRLGHDRLDRLHIHFSRIEFTDSGEKCHWTFADTQYGPEFMPLAKELVRRNLHPTIICESKGTMAEDAVAMKKMVTECRQIAQTMIK